LEFEPTLEILKQIPSLVSTSHDAWTSEAGTPFLNINGHYISAPADRPNDWEIVTDELVFMKIEGRHTGANIGSSILSTIDRYHFRGKVGWITSDGVAVNRSTACLLQRNSHPRHWL
jgi:hypothetical protein